MFACLLSKERAKEWAGVERVEKIWEEFGDGNYDENVLYEKNISQLKNVFQKDMRKSFRNPERM